MTEVATPNVLRRLRESHEERVLTVLRTHGAQSRAELGRRTGLSRATLYAIIQRLIVSEAVAEASAQTDPARGRGLRCPGVSGHDPRRFSEGLGRV